MTEHCHHRAAVSSTQRACVCVCVCQCVVWSLSSHPTQTTSCWGEETKRYFGSIPFRLFASLPNLHKHPLYSSTSSFLLLQFFYLLASICYITHTFIVHIIVFKKYFFTLGIIYFAVINYHDTMDTRITYVS